MQKILGYKLKIKRNQNDFEFLLIPRFEQIMVDDGWFGQAFALCKNCGNEIYHMMIDAELCTKCGEKFLKKLKNEKFNNFLNEKLNKQPNITFKNFLNLVFNDG